MKKIKLACLPMLFALGCAHTNNYAPALDDAAYFGGPFYHNSRNSLTWWGVYEGIIPSASGSGIKVRITLNRDYTFALSYEYLGRDNGVFSADGTFRWDDAGRNIKLEGLGDSPFRYPPHYRVGEMFLRQLDMDGNPIVGELAENYILRKVAE